MNAEAAKILIGSTVRQKPDILSAFLQSLTELDRSGLNVDCLFIDNNDCEEAGKMLSNFKMAGSTVFLGTDHPDDTYECSEETHFWNDRLIWKVAAYKDFILKFALDRNYTHVFMVDSDLILHPLTLKQLLSANRDIISEIFWTKWMPDLQELPQVWLEGQYSFHRGGNKVTDRDKTGQTVEMLTRLRQPGIYEVGGLGACTLISREALSKGVSYHRISNVDYWGEDRHFCIRAVVLGFKLYVDTHFPAFHIYRSSDLPRAKEYKKLYGWVEKPPSKTGRITNWQRKAVGNKLTLSMIVRNEEGRYLEKVLRHARQYIDAAVIVDDASKDNTAAICLKELDGIPLTLIQRKRSGFSNEYKLRKQQWKATIKTKPDWILNLDADEIFEDTAITEIKKIIDQTEFDIISFRLYDFWDENHYREDRFWCAHKFYRPLLIRYIPTFNYIWKETPVHCGRFPCNITDLEGTTSSLRVKHFGWADSKSRKFKYNRYLKSDPDGKYGILEQYRSIMEPRPNLVRWEE